MKKKYGGAVLLIALVAITIAALYAYREFNRRNPDLTNQPAAFDKTAAALLDEYSRDEHAANTSYLGKPVQVIGMLKTIEQDKGGYITLVLGEDGNSSSVRCALNEHQAGRAAALKSGTTIMVKGICTGYNPDEIGLGADVLLNRCVLIQK